MTEVNKYHNYWCNGSFYFCFKELLHVKFHSGITKVRMGCFVSNVNTSAKIYFSQEFVFGEMNNCELEYLPAEPIRKLVLERKPILLNFSNQMPLGIFIPDFSSASK